MPRVRQSLSDSALRRVYLRRALQESAIALSQEIWAVPLARRAGGVSPARNESAAGLEKAGQLDRDLDQAEAEAAAADQAGQLDRVLHQAEAEAAAADQALLTFFRSAGRFATWRPKSGL